VDELIGKCDAVVARKVSEALLGYITRRGLGESVVGFGPLRLLYAPQDPFGANDIGIVS
jgi:hypothetical protein